VTEFVKHLKGEIEATFKEDISIYFDENPHDRLQDTYNVNKSLEGKLKCLIFIPVLSQTYCDPGSYAWQNEFLVFNRLAADDSLGKDVKLRNGNVASRILPVRIHDLDPEDVKLFEKETGTVMRAVDFIFKTSSGVNRPLISSEDHPNDNLNKTYYRDQINKTVNAIKEIIVGLKTVIALPVKEIIDTGKVSYEIKKEEIKEAQPGQAKISRSKILSGIIFAVVLVAFFLAYPKIFSTRNNKIPKDPDGKISLSINTFQNLTGDTSLNYMEIGLPNILRGYLGNSNELSVQSTTTMDEVYQSMQLANNASLTPSLSREAAIKLKAGTYLTGSFQKIGDKTLIQVELNDTKRGIVLMSDTAEGIMTNLIDYKRISASISQKLKNFLEIKAISNITNIEFRDAFTSSSEAYRKYIKGMNSFMTGDYKSAIRLFKEAYINDTTFTLAMFYLANANYTVSVSSTDPLYSQQALFWTQKAYDCKERLPEDYQLWVEMWRSFNITMKSDSVLYYCSLLEKSDIKSRYYLYDIGVTYSDVFKMWDKGISLFQKIETISSEWGKDWEYKEYYRYYGDACHFKGMHEKEAKIYETGLKLYPDNLDLLYRQTRCALSTGDTNRAADLINKIIKLAKEREISQGFLESFFGNLYYETKSLVKAEEHFRAALKFEPDNCWRLNDLASFLFHNDKNISEGMNLINKAMEINPGDASGLLWTKGYGFYKQGRYREALDLLQQARTMFVGILPPLDKDIQNVKDSLNSQK
jgi:tetratricopeptide (TPR) repeat protein